MKCSQKLLSLLLLICISMTMLTGFSPVEVVSKTEDVKNEEFELPDIVDSIEAKENGYIGRVESEEKDLYTYVFANGDGTNTMRIYSHPVKYVAEDGSTRDISLGIKAKKEGGFVTAEHEITTTFESKLTKGIALAYNDIDIMLVPELEAGVEPTGELSNDGKIVTYEMDDTTSFVYKLTYAGFKEDIVVKEYTGQTEYEFTLVTNGLTLCEEHGSYYLTDTEGNIEATIGDIIIFTAGERSNIMGSMTYETVSANQEYVLTIHLDAGYLADEHTVYPIRIDPTIEINYDNNGTGAIEDVAINQNTTFSGTSGSLPVGRHPVGSLSRILMRFPSLSLSGISTGQITAATVELRDLMCQSNENITIDCHIYNTAAPAWSESGTTTWAGVGTAYLGSLLDSHLISYGQGNAGSQRYSFDIINAAKAWANGTESPAKGLVFKADNTFENQTGTDIKTWYKTFASYNRSAYRPSLSISYTATIFLNYSEVSIVEGGTRTLVATTSPGGQSITWSTSNSSVATVSTSGVVSANKAGVTTITASITDENGISHNAQCIIYICITNGVYYIQNCFTDYYLHVQNGKATGLPNVYQYSKYANSTNNNLKIRQMWKTYYLGEGRYSIRPMHKLNMALDVTGNNVDVYSIGTTDSLECVPYCAKWTIEWYSTGYVLKKDGSVYFALQVENASGSVGANINTDIYSNTLSQRWDFERISSPPVGALLYDTSTGYLISTSTEYVAPKESLSLSPFKLEPAFYSGTNINQDFYWYSSNTSKATVNSYTGEVTGISPGTVTITGRKNYSGTYYYVTYTVSITEIPNGVYFLINKQTGYYADIKGSTMASGTTIHQWEYQGGSSQKWIFEHLGDGYYSIKSSNSSSAYYMGVINDSTALDVDVVLRTGTISNGMMWKVEKTVNDAYKIIPKTGESSEYVLSTTTSAASNGYKLIQSDYLDNNSYRDEWLLHGFRDYTLMYIGYYVGDPLMPPIVQSVGTALETNAGMNGYRYTSLTKKELLVQLSSTAVFSCITHGYQTRIATSDGNLTISDINALDDTAFDNLKFVYYGACLTGAERSSDINLVNTTYNKGADAVLGFTVEVFVYETNCWTETFMLTLSYGSTLSTAMSTADEAVRGNDDISVPFYSTSPENRYLEGSDQVVPCN